MDTTKFTALLEKMKGGSDAAAWELVELYGPHIHAVVRRKMGASLRRTHDTGDFVQAAWASLIRGMPRMKDVDDPKRFVGLLATIACRRLANEVRRRAPADPDLLDGVNDKNQAGSPDTPSQLAIARERWFRLIEQMPPAHRDVVDLRLKGHTYGEIAKETGLNEKTARRIVKKASRLNEN